MTKRTKSKPLSKEEIRAVADRAEGKRVEEPSTPLSPPEFRAKKKTRVCYSEEIAIRICTHIAEGRSLQSFCRLEDTPNVSNVYRWLTAHDKFREMYTCAREDQADTHADEIVDIADNEPDTNKARVRIDARKWVACKLKPRKYGDKLQTEMTGKDGGPIETKDVSDIESAQRVAFMLGQALSRRQSASATA